MPKPNFFTIELDTNLAGSLRTAATQRGWTPEGLIIDCVAQQLEIALRHRVLIERLEQVDQHLITLAEFIGETTTDRGEIDVSTICRYQRTKPT